jgi:hypothetical protein
LGAGTKSASDAICGRKSAIAAINLLIADESKCMIMESEIP